MKSITPLFDLNGRTALVAGACGKIGRAICHALADQGAAVAVSDLNEKACRELVSELNQKAGSEAFSLQADWTNEKSVQEAMTLIDPSAKPLHIVIHCIGLISSVPIPGYAAPFEQQTLEAWNLALTSNLTSAFLLAKATQGRMASDGKASVIFLSSIYGSFGPNMSLYEGTGMGNPVAYGASKGGLQQFARYLATQWAPLVRVNVVSPGGIERAQPDAFIRRYEKMTPLGRMAHPNDVAGPVVFLASDAAQYVTGQNLLVDGGWSAW
ncbi:MAG TPA: short-chain dehydrogenase [Verrucomicrobia bacterium]|nr:MAG: hypothetical protein A2X46_08705 [Lentisphaerae bacterium GWF2_57_35]HBA82756.1 short-chain dehydrogenase [Verrucomicrobiota bacterium]